MIMYDYIQGVEWILVHIGTLRVIVKSSDIGSPNYFPKNLKYKSCRVKKNVPKSFSNYFITPSSSVGQEKLNIKDLPIK
jgi:hypothetical protein